MSTEKYMGDGVFASFDWMRMELILRAPCKASEADSDNIVRLPVPVLDEINKFLAAMQRLHEKRMKERARDEEGIAERLHRALSEIREDCERVRGEVEDNVEWLYGKPKN